MKRRQPSRRQPVDIFSLPVIPPYKVRFVRPEHSAELVNNYHLARTALCSKPIAEQSPYHRMVWASAAFARSHNYVSAAGAYKDLCGLLDR